MRRIKGAAGLPLPHDGALAVADDVWSLPGRNNQGFEVQLLLEIQLALEQEAKTLDDTARPLKNVDAMNEASREAMLLALLEPAGSKESGKSSVKTDQGHSRLIKIHECESRLIKVNQHKYGIKAIKQQHVPHGLSTYSPSRLLVGVFCHRLVRATFPEVVMLDGPAVLLLQILVLLRRRRVNATLQIAGQQRISQEVFRLALELAERHLSALRGGAYPAAVVAVRVSLEEQAAAVAHTAGGEGGPPAGWSAAVAQLRLLRDGSHPAGARWLVACGARVAAAALHGRRRGPRRARGGAAGRRRERSG